jgi:hypothetical protein
MEHGQVGHHHMLPMIGVQCSIQIKESHSLKMWIILEFGAHILSDQCVCVDLLTGARSLCHDGLSIHRSVLSPHLEAALTKIKVLPQ